MGKGRRVNTYRKIKSQRKRLIPLGQAMALTVVIAFLFYKAIYGMAAGVLVVPFWMRIKSREKQEQDHAQVEAEYKEYMMLIVSGLQAGYSLERAVRQSEEELLKLYPNGSILAGHVHIMNQKIAMNVQLEKAFDEFARAIKLEEAISLAEIISFAKRSGGDYGRHIRDTAMKIEKNISVKQEIETITTEKRLELKVMSFMPLGILAYISITSPGFIAPLYGNILGVVLMSGCLVTYGLFVLLGKRIIDIKV